MEAHFRTGSDCNFFENWRIRSGSDWQNFSCIYVIILNIWKILVVIRFYRFAKSECILPWMAKVLLRQFCNSNCIHLYEHITLSSSSKVNIVEWLASIPAVQVLVHSALAICFGSEWSDNTFDGNAFCVAYFFKCLGFRAVVFNLGVVCLFSVGRESFWYNCS